MKVALVHDWLTGMRGGERCLEAFLKLYPQADIFTLIHIPGSTSAAIDARVKQASWLSSLPGVRRYYRALLPLFPAAISEFDLSNYDLVVSLSHAAAKNVRIKQGTRHICYCFTPMRYIWDQARTYLGALVKPLWPIIIWLRAWDRRGSRGVTEFCAISRFVAARIRCFYRRKARVVYPPTEIERFEQRVNSELVPSEPAFLYAGALVPYKGVELILEAARQLGLPLWVVGRGPLEKKLRAEASANVKFFGHVSDQDLVAFYQNCRALLFPVREDFGLVPIECLAAGRPVIALSSGACRETVIGYKPWDSKFNAQLDQADVCGVFIRKCEAQQQVNALLESLRFFMQHEQQFSEAACRRQARKFSADKFYKGWKELAGHA